MNKDESELSRLLSEELASISKLEESFKACLGPKDGYATYGLCRELSKLVRDARETFSSSPLVIGELYSSCKKLAASAKETSRLLRESTPIMRGCYFLGRLSHYTKKFNNHSIKELLDRDEPKQEFEELAESLSQLSRLYEFLATEGLKDYTKKGGRPQNFSKSSLAYEIGFLMKSHGYKLSATPGSPFRKVLETAFSFLDPADKKDKRRLADKAIKELRE